MCVFGYEDRDEYLEYVREGEQDIECIAAWVIEMLLAAHEIQAYCLGIHPNPVCFQFHTSDDNDEITNTEHPIDNTHRLKDIPEAPQERANGQQKADDDIDDDDEQQQMEPSAHKMVGF